MKTFERRMAVTGLEVRDEGDDLTLRGYASTFNQPYSMGWYTESVDAGAFKRTLGQKPDVRLLINHDGLPLARTASGTLTLSTDSIGLLASAKLNRNDPDVAALEPKMKRGDVDQMSFGFRVVDNDKGEPGHMWSPDMSQRTLTNLDLNGGDVSVVTYPANPNTSVGLRSGGRVPIEAMTSALLEMEKRGASTDDIRALLTRMQEAFGDAVPSVDPSVSGDPDTSVTQETSEVDEQQLNAARIAKENRARVLALL